MFECDHCGAPKAELQQRCTECGGHFRLLMALNRVAGWPCEFVIGDVVFAAGIDGERERENLIGRFAFHYPTEYHRQGLPERTASPPAAVAVLAGRALWLLHEPLPCVPVQP